MRMIAELSEFIKDEAKDVKKYAKMGMKYQMDYKELSEKKEKKIQTKYLKVC